MEHAEYQYQVIRRSDGVTVTIHKWDSATRLMGLPVWSVVGNLQPSALAQSKSPIGFEYGYGGSGPAALAHSLLVHALTDIYGYDLAEEIANRVYQSFKAERVQTVPQNKIIWDILSSEIVRWVESAKAHVVKEVMDENEQTPDIELDMGVWGGEGE